MGKTIRNNSSNPNTSNVNRERTQKRMTTNVCANSDSWKTRNSAGRKSFSYTNSPHGRACFKNSSEFKRRHSAKANLNRKREREDKLNRYTEEIGEAQRESDVFDEKEEGWTRTTHFTQQRDESSTGIWMKFGCTSVRLQNTYTFRAGDPLLGEDTGECLVKCINGKFLVIQCDLVLDDIEYLYSDFAWEWASIGELTRVILPESLGFDPQHTDIQGWFTLYS